jgi:hypothetical protein
MDGGGGAIRILPAAIGDTNRGGPFGLGADIVFPYLISLK